MSPDTKRVLFIGLSYYSYTGQIIEALRKKGFSVDHYPAEARSFWSKTTKKFFPSVYRALLARYHERIVASSREVPYDYVFFLQIHNIALHHVAALRSSQPAARFILYNWDSLTTHDYRPHLPFLDAVSTFDPEDARQLGIGYLPLFALPEYSASAGRPVPNHDIYFVGAIGTLERFDAVLQLDKYCQQQGLRFLKHLHCSPATLLKLVSRGLFMRGLSLRSLSTEQIVARMNDSAAVFDFPNRPQSGYTMRLIENLCAGQRIVTSNARVRQEPFYSEDQFFVMDDIHFAGLKEFLKADISESKASRRVTRHGEFSLDHWLDSIFER